ncbi:MAG: sensor histidine kinase, partial [Chitinophagia bacterium]|nr:sensor histidine kinase [Chitinophagia bacterium]
CLEIADGTGNSQKHIDYLFTYSVAGDGHYFLGRLSDVTEIKNKEHVFSKIIEREKELNAQKSLFIRITSHELRTPLAVILANAEILQIIDARADGGGGSMLTARAVARIVREVNLMSDLLEQLTIVGKIEDGAVALEFKEYDLGEVISELCRELFQPYKDGRNISLVLPKILPSIIMDKRLFRHALTNLINNAFKYSQGFQPPQLYVSLQEKAVLVSVSDKGIGIPKNDLKKIFNTFYRGSNIGNIQGTGVGLMIVDYVVKKHKWRLDVDSAVNEGSTFTIKINL